MSAPLKNILLLGATGNIGAPILTELLAVDTFNVSVAVRASSKSSSFPGNVKVHTVDYEDASSLDRAVTGQDVIVSALTFPAVQQQKAIIDSAVKAGVKRFLPSEFGIDTSRPTAEEILPATGLKREVVSYLKQTESSMSWTALSVGAFFDWAFTAGFAGYDFEKKTARVIGDEVSWSFVAC